MSESTHQTEPANIPESYLGMSDGIVTENGIVPGWWKWIFIATIAIAPPYMFFFHNGAEGRSLEEHYDVELASNLELQFKEIGTLTLDRENVVKYLYEPSWLQVGKIVFRSNCASCHGKEGGGLVGPNLCDDSYKNVKDIGDILRVVQNGANAGAMPAWGTRLSPNQLVLVASYVASLRGSSPAVAKAAEGRKIDEWPGPPAEPEPNSDAAPENGVGQQPAVDQPAVDQPA